MRDHIPFNKPFIIGNELDYIKEAVESGKISGNGNFTKKCQSLFEDNYKIRKALLTTSCTDALEMAAILVNINEGDEVILPSYTFVSTANAFILRGAKLVFADSLDNHPNVDPGKIEELITHKTKAIVVVHYGGVACDMDKITTIALKHNISVIEDAAQAIESYYKGKQLGTIGDLGTFSFHETKNIIAGEGGLLAVNDKNLISRSEIIWEKGTNRSAFFRGEIDKYGWVDIGSSFLPSELIAAFLYAQLENIEKIQNKRKQIWQIYDENLRLLNEKTDVELPVIPEYATNNAHLYYIVTTDEKERDDLIKHLKKNNIHAVFHYVPLHKSEYYKSKHDGRKLENVDKYSDRLLRLPIYYQLEQEDVSFIADKIIEFYN